MKNFFPMAEQKNDLMDKIVSLCKRRGFVFPSSEIYGGLANAWDFGPYGSQMKKNIKDHWWRFFVERRDDMVGLDGAIIMNPKTWEASGHTENFSDPLIECKECHNRFRADQVQGIEVTMKPGGMGLSWKISGDSKCEVCGKNNFAEPTIFNLMLESGMGPVHLGSLFYQLGQEDVANIPGKEGRSEKGKEIEEKIRRATVYLRPETAQAMFVDFANIANTSRKKLPFGVAQIGKSFRNEITPGNFIFRTREFEQMEIEYFFDPAKTDWNERFEHWKTVMEEWMEAVGIDPAKTHPTEVPDGERAHYSKRTIDFEFDYPFGRKELFGLAYRGDYDLSRHEEVSGQELRIADPETGEKIRPHVIEPSLGVERGMLAVLLSAYEEQVLEGGDIRAVLHLKPEIAPVQIAVFPLLKNRPELVAKAREIFGSLKEDFRVEFDDNGNVGKRYRRQDEIGTPYCVTVDFDTIGAREDRSLEGTITVRDRDTMKQERVKISELREYFAERLK